MYHRRLVPTGPTWSAVQLETIMAKRSKHVEMAEEPKGPVEAPASTAKAEAPAGPTCDAKTGRVEAYAPGTFNASTRRPQKA